MALLNLCMKFEIFFYKIILLKHHESSNKRGKDQRVGRLKQFQQRTSTAAAAAKAAWQRQGRQRTEAGSCFGISSVAAAHRSAVSHPSIVVTSSHCPRVFLTRQTSTCSREESVKSRKVPETRFWGFSWENAAAPNGGRGEEGGADPGEAVASLQSLHSSKGRFLF